MKKRIIVALMAFILTTTFMQAQPKVADTVVIKVGEASKITFTIQNKADLETLKKYDFQALMNDLIKKLEQKDTSANLHTSREYLKTDHSESAHVTVETNADPKEEENWNHRDNHREKRYGRHTYQSINFDIGTNNYLSSGKFPDQGNSLYTVKPWGSWYVGINSVQRTRLASKFYLEWSLGASWYNFKFQNEQTQITKDNSGVLFALDTRDADFKKSKLTATYLNASIVPMIDFGGNKRKPSFFDGRDSESFRIGVGPYVGYRIDSYSKQVFKENGDERKPRDHDNFYLNNIRYGLRTQVGFKDVDLFFNYDMNELFVENKGPKLNAFSFGVTF
jgi:Skp family chaperone for outer membrane proteins